MTIHRHTCRACKPRMFLNGPRQGEHHVAVRLGDAAPGHKLIVLVDGQDNMNVAEALAGYIGVAWVYTMDETGHYHTCCGRGTDHPTACETMLSGRRVEIRTKGVAA